MNPSKSLLLILALCGSCAMRTSKPQSEVTCLPPFEGLRSIPAQRSCGDFFGCFSGRLIGISEKGRKPITDAEFWLSTNEHKVSESPDRIVIATISKKGAFSIPLNLGTSTLTWHFEGKCYREEQSESVFVLIRAQGYEPKIVRFTTHWQEQVIELAASNRRAT